MKWNNFLCLVLVLAIVSPCIAQIRLVAKYRVPRPVDMTTDGISNRLYFVSQTGVIYWTENTNSTEVIPSNSSAFHVFLNVSGRIIGGEEGGDERGLLGLAFPPDYAQNRWVFIYYCGLPARDNTYQTNYIVRYKVTPNFASVDPTTRKVIWQLDDPFPNHNGGQTRFGRDGFLYVALGDGGNAGDPFRNAQDLGTQWGKIIRIDVLKFSGNQTYSIPPGNPFANTNSPFIRREIWAYGLRNPYRFSFDNETGLMFASDAGQEKWEEIDIIKKGGNYGWNIVEGPACYLPPTGCNRTGLISPIFVYNHSLSFLNPDSVVVIGGYVYRGSSAPSLRGKYVFADSVSGVIWALSFNPADPFDNSATIIHRELGLNVASFGIDQKRELYVLSLDGVVYHVRE